MGAFVLILALQDIRANANSAVTNVAFQEFRTMEQCEYAAKILRERVGNIQFVACINK